MTFEHPFAAAVAGLLALAAIGCAADDAGGPGAATVVDSAGVSIVTSPGEVLDRPLDVVLAAEPHLRIGTIDGGEETQLTRIASAQRLSDGRLLLAESGAQRVRLFSAEGDFLNWIGRVGQGPAEYLLVREAGLLEGDTVWVYDTGSREFEMFTPEGRPVRTFRPQRPPGVQMARRAWMLPGGTVVDEGSTLAIGNPSEMEPGDFREDVVVSLLDRDGQDAAEITRAPGISYRIGRAGENGERRTFTAIFDLRFRPLPQYEGGGDLLVHADPGAFEIRTFSLDGRLRGIARIDAPRRPLTQPMIEAYETTMLEAAAGDPRAMQGTRTALENYVYADSLPHFQAPHVERSGIVWLMEYGIAGEDRGSYRLWRVDPGTGLRGYLTLPTRLSLLSIEGDELLGYERDDFDVPYLVAYRLIPRS